MLLLVEQPCDRQPSPADTAFMGNRPEDLPCWVS
jgi:hypothetical protein